MTAEPDETRTSASSFPIAKETTSHDGYPHQDQRGSEHRLGPLVRFIALEHPFWGRLYAIALATLFGAGLWLAADLHPNGSYLGTHRQLHLPPCGFYLMTGFPCPTCGMTTAFAYTIHGQVLQAVRAQLAGFLAALVVIGAMGFSIGAAISGKRPSLNWYRINPVYVVWASAGIVLAAWFLKIVWGLAEGTLPAGE